MLSGRCTSRSKPHSFAGMRHGFAVLWDDVLALRIPWQKISCAPRSFSRDWLFSKPKQLLMVTLGPEVINTVVQSLGLLFINNSYQL